MGIKSHNKTFFIILIIFAAVMIFFKSLKWVLDEKLGFFYFYFLIFLLSLYSVFILIFLIISIRKKQFVPAIATVLICVLVILIPFDHYFESIRFLILKNKMEQTAVNVINNYVQIEDDKIDNIILPAEFQYLSRYGGEVLLFHSGQSSAVFFYTYSILMDGFGGYAYLSDSNAEKLIANYADWNDVKRIDSHWSFYTYAD